MIGDMISPVKASVGPGYGEMDLTADGGGASAVWSAAVLPVAIKKAIKQADKISAWLEAVQIAGFSEAEADKFFGRPGSEIMRGLEIRLRAPAVVRSDYVARHRELLAAFRG